ncbi:hypothetical protein FACS189446_0670 [Bacteroidia bacterium]|nr:hypothetical protein FACS189446_0670 [Bacteroidia bacterium]
MIRQLGFYSLLILVTTSLAYSAGAAGWNYCIDSGKKPSFKQLFMVRHIGNTITLFNPTGAIAGELFNAKMLIDEGIPEQDAYKSVLLSRALMAISQLIIFIVVLVWFMYFLSDRLPVELLYAVYICFFLFLMIVSAAIYLLLKKGKEVTALAKDKKWHKFIHRIREMRFLLTEHIRRRPWQTALAFFLFTLHWFLGSLELYVILHVLKFDIQIGDGLFLDTVIIVLKSMATFIPGQLGIEELINKFVLHLVGLSSPGLWLSVSILRRSRQLFWCGMAFIFYMHLKKRKKSVKNYGNTICKS